MRGRLENILAQKLREIAKNKGIALSHLADRAGIARSYLWLLLSGRSSATLDAVQRLAETLDVEPLSLLSAAEMVTLPAPELPTAAERGPPRGKRAAATADDDASSLTNPTKRARS